MGKKPSDLYLPSARDLPSPAIAQWPLTVPQPPFSCGKYPEDVAFHQTLDSSTFKLFPVFN